MNSVHILPVVHSCFLLGHHRPVDHGLFGLRNLLIAADWISSFLELWQFVRVLWCVLWCILLSIAASVSLQSCPLQCETPTDILVHSVHT